MHIPVSMRVKKEVRQVNQKFFKFLQGVYIGIAYVYKKYRRQNKDPGGLGHRDMLDYISHVRHQATPHSVYVCAKHNQQPYLSMILAPLLNMLGMRL